MGGLRTTRLALLVQLFGLQAEYGFMLSSKWIPTAEDEVADYISRPSRGTIILIPPAALMALWDEMGPFNVDRMACAASVPSSLVSGEALPLFFQYDCAGAVGTDLLTQDVSIVPGTKAPAVRFRFTALVMAGHTVENLAECKAHAIVLVPDVKAYWFPVVQFSAVGSITVAPLAALPMRSRR